MVHEEMELMPWVQTESGPYGETYAINPVQGSYYGRRYQIAGAPGETWVPRTYPEREFAGGSGRYTEPPSPPPPRDPSWSVRTETGPAGEEWVQNPLTDQWWPSDWSRIPEILQQRGMGVTPPPPSPEPAPVPGGWYSGRLQEPRYALEALKRAYSAQASPWGREVLSNVDIQPYLPPNPRSAMEAVRAPGIYWPNRNQILMDMETGGYGSQMRTLRHEMGHAAEFAPGSPWEARSAPQEWQRDFFGTGGSAFPGTSVHATNPIEQYAIAQQFPWTVPPQMRGWYPQYDWPSISSQPPAIPRSPWRPNPLMRIEHDPYGNEYSYYEMGLPYSALSSTPWIDWGRGAGP